MVAISKRFLYQISRANGLSCFSTPLISLLYVPQKSLKRWIKDDLGNLGYPLIGDVTKQVSRDYGVLLQEQGIATRGTFVIDPEGTIQYMGNHNLNVGRDAGEILRVLTACKSGELCGAGWKPGDTHVKAQ